MCLLFCIFALLHRIITVKGGIDMSKQPHESSENTVILPTAPGANPSSFPDFNVPVVLDPLSPGDGGEAIDLPGGSRIAPNGAVIEEPMSAVPEIDPPNEYTPDKEDLDLMIM